MACMKEDQVMVWSEGFSQDGGRTESFKDAKSNGTYLRNLLILAQSI